MSLLAAIEQGDVPGVREAIAAGEDVNVWDTHGLKKDTSRERKAWCADNFEEELDLVSYTYAKRFRRTALMHAVIGGNDEIVQMLVTAGADVNAADRLGFTPLMIALIHGLAEIAMRLIGAGADVRARNWDKRTPLDFALGVNEAMTAHAPMVKALLDAGADPNTRDGEGRMILITAVEHGASEEIVRLLIEAGADPNVSRKMGEDVITAYDELMMAGKTRDAFFLLRAGADPFRPKMLGSTALGMAAASGSTELVGALIERGANVTERSARQGTALHSAANTRTSGTGEVARRLIALGAEINARDETGSTPLLLAASQGNLDVIRTLLSFGADTSIPLAQAADPRITERYRGYTPLLIAIAWLEIDRRYTRPPPDRVEIVRALVAGGADATCPGDDGATPLSMAERFKRDDMVRILRRGASSRREVPAGLFAAVEAGDAAGVIESLSELPASGIVNERGETPLARAAALGHATVVEALLRAGASPDEAEADTPLGLAAASGHAPVVSSLIAAGANLDERTRGGLTPLMVAAAAGHLDVVRLLVEAGASVDATDPWGSHTSALSCALERGHESVWEYLAPLTPAEQVEAAASMAQLREDLRRMR